MVVGLEALLKELALEEFASAFADEGFVSPEDLAELEEDDLKEVAKDVGMKRGHLARLKSVCHGAGI